MIRFFEATAPDPLNDEALRVVVAQPMEETPIRRLYPLTEAGDTARKLYPVTEDGGSVAGGVLSHMMDESTVEIPPPPRLPRLLPVTIPPLPLPPIPTLNTPSTQICFPAVIPTTRSHSRRES